MLHNTLSALLVSVASRYAQLSPSDVGIGIGGGRLVIDDVQLRADTFNGPHIPFHVRHGRAGRLRVNVPWGALSSTPVQVYLENIHLIATPKQHSVSVEQIQGSVASKQTPPLQSPKTSGRDHPWHQTNVGRLLFNISVEMYGLKIEYRDTDCIGVLSIASLRAFSAGPDWSMRFVSLASDLDRDQPNASAVAMRKTINLTGVHLVMIPRAKLASSPQKTEVRSPTTTVNDISQSKTDAEKQGTVGSSIDPEVQPKKQFVEMSISDRNLDLDSFESQNPILDGVSISLRVLCFTGATVLPKTDHLTPGLHGEIFVDIDDSTVKLTARQLMWLQHILRQGLEAFPTPAIKSPRTTSPTKSAVHSADSVSTNADQIQQANQEDLQETQPERNTRSAPEMRSRQSRRQSSFRSIWEAIVGENNDETVDDPAIALGLRSESDEGRSNRGPTTQRRRRGLRRDFGDGGKRNEPRNYIKFDDESDDSYSQDATANEMIDRDHDDDDDDHVESTDQRNARRAVAAAAACGGATWQIHLRTADSSAWERLRELEKKIAKDRSVADNAEATHTAYADAQEREAAALQKAEEATNRADFLEARNQTLANELRELERLTSESGRNRDVVIRELQDALAKTERKLRMLSQNSLSQLPTAEGSSSRILDPPVNNQDSHNKRAESFYGNQSVQTDSDESDNNIPPNSDFRDKEPQHSDATLSDPTLRIISVQQSEQEHKKYVVEAAKNSEVESLRKEINSEEVLVGKQGAQVEERSHDSLLISKSDTAGSDGSNRDTQELDSNADVSLVKTGFNDSLGQTNIGQATTASTASVGFNEGHKMDDSLVEVQLDDSNADSWSQRQQGGDIEDEVAVTVLSDENGNVINSGESEEILDGDTLKTRSQNDLKGPAVFDDDGGSLDAFYDADGTRTDRSDMHYDNVEEHMDTNGLMLI